MIPINNIFYIILFLFFPLHSTDKTNIITGKQGETILIRISPTIKIVNAVLVFNNKEHPLLKNDNGIFFLIPIELEEKEGIKKFSIHYRTETNKTKNQTVRIKIEKRAYKTQEIRTKRKIASPEKTTCNKKRCICKRNCIPPQKPGGNTTRKKKRSLRNIKNFKERFLSVIENSKNNNQYSVSFFPLSFKKPCAITKLTSSFGNIRMVDSTIQRHYGADLVGKKKDSVFAAHTGTIIIKGLYPITGNTIVLDHGGGVRTVYFHLDSMTKKNEGEKVKTKEEIGRIGKTGRATGYHLHFGVSINGIWTDPMQWIDIKRDQRMYTISLMA